MSITPIRKITTAEATIVEALLGIAQATREGCSTRNHGLEDYQGNIADALFAVAQAMERVATALEQIAEQQQPPRSAA